MYFQLKTEQAVQKLQAFAFCVVSVNSTVVLKHLEDLKGLIIWNILKEKLVMSCLLGSFILKLYSFKFPYNFTGQLKNLKLLMVMVKVFDKYHDCNWNRTQNRLVRKRTLSHFAKLTK